MMSLAFFSERQAELYSTMADPSGVARAMGVHLGGEVRGRGRGGVMGRGGGGVRGKGRRRGDG